MPSTRLCECAYLQSVGSVPNRCATVIVPPFPSGCPVRRRIHAVIASMAMRSTPRASSGFLASSHRRGQGTVSTHWRTATHGKISSTHFAASEDIRRPPHAGQNPRPLHEKGTSR